MIAAAMPRRCFMPRENFLYALLKNNIALCDAGVGIGKTYAYLTGCILLRKNAPHSAVGSLPVVVSTSSIALQDAIIEEYIPFLSRIFLENHIIQKPIRAIVRKGKERFVCDVRLAQRLEAVKDKKKNGHHMLDGGMFSDLDLYKKKSFWEKHKTIRFDTLDEIAEYEILAVIVTTAYRPDSFRYYEYTGGSQEQFEKYVSDCKRLSLYDTGVNAEYGDKLITLSTCEYSQNDGRLLVVAKKTED